MLTRKVIGRVYITILLAFVYIEQLRNLFK